MSNYYYLAYGSNLHPLRLLERISSCEFIETQSLNGYRLHFHKHSLTDGSGKGNMILTNNPNDTTFVAIYRMNNAHKPLLDEFEGEGYETTSQNLVVEGVERKVFWYRAIEDYIDDTLKPYCWYRQLILLGAQFHQFPKAYIEAIKAVNSTPDPVRERLAKHEQLIARIQQYRHEKTR